MTGKIALYKCGRCGNIQKSRPSRLKAADHPTRCSQCWSRGLMEEVVKCHICSYMVEVEVNRDPKNPDIVICPQCKATITAPIAKPKEPFINPDTFSRQYENEMSGEGAEF